MAPAGDVKQKQKRNLLDDSDSDSDNGGAAVAKSGFNVNKEYAARFEHNKKREEQQRLEEKFKNGQNDDDDDSSSDETEDENGFLATEDLDAQISATLQAIRSKDPRVYDDKTTFYLPETDEAQAAKEKKDKPVFLKDYHREKIMRGDIGQSDDEDEPAPQTYTDEQEALKKAFTQAAADGDSSDSDEDGFMLKKKAGADKEKTATSNGVHPSRKATITAAGLDIDGADRDPETFLSNFMSARAWVDDEGSKWKAFESDDGEDDGKADEFEQAYNLRFEDPTKSNEVLRSYARDVTNSRSVRREEKSGRKRQRELEKERKEEEKQKRKDEKARLRKLKLDEAGDKLRKIKQAAGQVGKELTDAEWMGILDGAWENDKWEEEMQKRFGDDYYALQDEGAADSDNEPAEFGGKKGKPKKPKWDDDIDIKDLVPEFDDEEAKPTVNLSDEDAAEDAEQEAEDDDDEDTPAKKKRKTADHKKARQESQKQARQERAQLESLVDAKMELTDHDLLRQSSRLAEDAESSKTELQPFRYRETSPQTFGMTPRDILLAPSDKALNEFAGLKKLATFREQEKKQKDRKRLGKKARLRQWRRDVFGSEYERSGPTFGFEKYATEEDAAADAAALESKGRQHKKRSDGNVDAAGGDASKKKKRKRSKGSKATEA
ncbi:Kinetochore protein Spc24 [Lecanicillium sp. MT-2017a]|nr:Kinetochore protein Spc24 [Lecanicillium sp. MT-2017a]